MESGSSTPNRLKIAQSHRPFHAITTDMAMPIMAMATAYMASIARITRSSMLEVLTSNHIRTARAKGLPGHKIITRHALKPALIPVLSYLGPVFVAMITGSVVVDMLFSTAGIGKFSPRPLPAPPRSAPGR